LDLALLIIASKAFLEDKPVQPIARKRRVAVVKAREAGIPEWIAFKLE